MTYDEYKRDLAVRILRNIFSQAGDLPDCLGKALDEFLPTDESGKRGPTEFTDLVCVYKVDCPDCDASPEYTDVHPFCPECGYTFN
jgi:hypothetical protein